MKKYIAFIAFSTIILSGCAVRAIPEIATHEASPPHSLSHQVRKADSNTNRPNLLESSWQTAFFREQSKNSALAEAFAHFEANRNESCPTGYALHLQEPITEEAEVREIIEETIAIYCHVLREDVSVIIGNYKYAKDQMSANDYAADDYGGVCGKASPGWSTGCALYNTTWQHIKFSDFPLLNQLVAHEIFHIVQGHSNDIEYTRIPPGDDRYMPTWFVEGFAMVYQGALLEYLGIEDYSGSYGYDPDLFVPSWFLEEIDLAQREADWSLGTYAVGHFAVEYLIANVGFEAVLDVWEEMGKGESFDDAFAIATGLTVGEFYETVSRISLQH